MPKSKLSDNPTQFPQYQCPVPRCRGKAAPVFGMVCTKHQHVGKRAIKAFRKARAERRA